MVRRGTHRAAVAIFAAAAFAYPAFASGQFRPDPDDFAPIMQGSGALVGATVIDGTGRPGLADAVVIFRDGRITCVGRRSECRVPSGMPEFDVSGRWIIPGLIDGHVHYSQTGWADGRPDQAADLRDRFSYAAAVAENRADPGRYFRAWLCSGVTATWDVGGYPWTWDLTRRTENDPFAPHVSAAGPLLSARDHWLNLPAERQFLHLSDAETVERNARYLVESGAAQVKVWYLVSEDQDDAAHYQAMLRIAAGVARDAGVPLIVHATGLWQAKDALRAGASHLVHSVYDREVDDEFVQLMLDTGASYNPTLTVSDGIGQFAERAFVTDGLDLGCVDGETLAKARLTAAIEGGPDEAALARRRAGLAERHELMGRNLARLHAAGVPIVMGTDAGNTLTLHGPSIYREMGAMQEAGMTPMDVLVASTRNAARAMGRGRDLGTLEVGKIADLVVLNSDPSADIARVRTRTWVVRAGWLHRVADLRFR